MNPRKLLWVVLAWVVLPVAVFAEEATPVINNLEQVDCFAEGLYKFQSVQVGVAPEHSIYKPGEVIKFYGEIINENSYPVVDGNIFVRISKINSDSSDLDTIGHDVVDEFVALSDVSVNGSSTKPVEFPWKIPASLGKGEYRADYFFSVDKRFNLGGLPFTNEIIINFSQFQIDSSEEVYFELDRESTTVNDEKYRHIGFWPQFEFGDRVVFTQPLKNLSDKDLSFDVSYDLYYWDSLRPEDKIDSRTEKITVPAKKSANLSYTLDAVKEPVYYLKITAKNNDTQSIVNLRVVSESVKGRINYAALTNFPIKKNEEFKIFSCLQSLSLPVENAHAEMSLYNKKGKKIFDGAYDGQIESSINGIFKKIVLDSDIDYLRMKLDFFDGNGKLQDSYENIYDCKDLGQEFCLNNQFNNQNFINVLVFVLFIIIVLLIISLRFKFSNSISKRVAISLLFICLIIVGVLLFYFLFSKPIFINAGSSNSESLQKSTSVTRDWRIGLHSDQTDKQIIGNATYTNNPTLSGGVSVSGNYIYMKVGNTLSMSNNSSCTWVGTGAYYDTPNCGVSETKLVGNARITARIDGSYGTETSTSDDPKILKCSAWNSCKALVAGDTKLTFTRVGTLTGTGSAVAPLGSSGNRSAIFYRDGIGETVDNTVDASVVWNIRVYENGDCGSADGSAYYVKPTTNLCDVGKESTVSGSGPWTWTCGGVNGGSPSGTCTANKKSNGDCGSADGSAYYVKPTTNLCDVGKESTVSGSGPWTWTCGGVNEGSPSGTCTANKKINGVCSTTNNTCVAGTPNNTPNDPANKSVWLCEGINTGTTANCEISFGIVGLCGSADKTNVYSDPTSPLERCATGHTFTDTANETNKFNWKCTGPLNGTVPGIATACYANKKIDGVCSTTNNTCVAGTLNNTPNDPANKSVWLCEGINTGTTANCEINLGIPGVCKEPPHKAELNIHPTDGESCAAGSTFHNTTDSDLQFKWACVGPTNNGVTGTVTGCYAWKIIPGVCNENSHELYAVQHPEYPNMCESTVRSLTLRDTPDDNSSQYKWTCLGSHSPISDECYALKTTVCNPSDYAVSFVKNMAPVGGTCQIDLTVDSKNVPGSCIVKDKFNNPIGSVINYSANQNKTYEILVSPQNEYTISCTDDCIGATTIVKTGFNCILNPTVIEQ